MNPLSVWKKNEMCIFILLCMQGFELTRILGCRKDKDSAPVMGLTDWKCRGFIPSN